eukprot:7385315-Prymnesium_polylepis.3
MTPPATSNVPEYIRNMPPENAPPCDLGAMELAIVDASVTVRSPFPTHIAPPHFCAETLEIKLPVINVDPLLW